MRWVHLLLWVIPRWLTKSGLSCSQLGPNIFEVYYLVFSRPKPISAANVFRQMFGGRFVSKNVDAVKHLCHNKRHINPDYCTIIVPRNGRVVVSQ